MSEPIVDLVPALEPRLGAPPPQNAKRLGSAPSWPGLRRGLLQGRFVPFLGAGASSYSYAQPGGAPPSAIELTAKLAEEAQIAFDCERCGGDLSRVASYYQLCVQTRAELDEFVRDQISKPSFRPNPLHHLLAAYARTKPMLIITTNYDDLLERAFDAPEDGKGAVPYEVVATSASDLAKMRGENDATVGSEAMGQVLHWISSDEKGNFSRIPSSKYKIDLKARSVIYKIHGTVPRKPWNGVDPGEFLIAEEDYIRFLGSMQRFDLIPAQLKGELSKTYSFMFLGYSIKDWNLRVFLEELKFGRKARNEERHHAFMRDVNPIDRALLVAKNVNVYECELAEFVEQISSPLP